jgi:ubiquinone/menaquinone biosynthesis C-methylase UbiE
LSPGVFGDIPQKRKRRPVQEHVDSLTGRYDLFNSRLSLGIQHMRK